MRRRKSQKSMRNGELESGADDIRASQCHISGDGASSGYLPISTQPGWLVRGTSFSNAENICRVGLFRSGRLRIHLGRTVDGAPNGIREGSEVGVAIDGDECVRNGMVFYESAKRVALTGGFDGGIAGNLITQVFSIRGGGIL